MVLKWVILCQNKSKYFLLKIFLNWHQLHKTCFIKFISTYALVVQQHFDQHLPYLYKNLALVNTDDYPIQNGIVYLIFSGHRTIFFNNAVFQSMKVEQCKHYECPHCLQCTHVWIIQIKGLV